MRFSILLFTLLISTCFALRTTQEWVNGNRRIYQVVTDRYATDGTPGYCDTRKWCGGTWKALERRLDYISELGFNAIWISPFTRQIDTAPGETYEPYHAYHSKDMYGFDPHFGTESDLRSLVNAAHARDIWVIMDIVVNHMGPVNYSDANPYAGLTPFNSPDHYHDCNGCPAGCSIQHWDNLTEIEHCRLSDLPDLDQDNSSVRKELLKWVKWVSTDFGFDGLRVDTVLEVKNSFWAEMHDTAVGTDGYTIGELFDGHNSILFDAVSQGHYPALFAYPLFFAMQDSIFNGRDMFYLSQSISELRTKWAALARPYRAHHAMSPFTSNHDNPRLWRLANGDVEKIKASIAFVMTIDGVPCFYYGEEQLYKGGAKDYDNREPLWLSNYNTTDDLPQFVSKVNYVRDLYGAYFGPNHPAQIALAEGHVMVYHRGPVLTVINNAGQSASNVTVSLRAGEHPFAAGEKVCNVFWSSHANKEWTGDCVTIENGLFRTELLHGESKIFVRQHD